MTSFPKLLVAALVAGAVAGTAYGLVRLALTGQDGWPA